MRYLVRLLPHSVSRVEFLASVRSLARATGAEARNPKWTSYGALEIDIFAPSKADLDTFLAAVGPLGGLEFSSDLNLAPTHVSDDELFSEAKAYFNSERFWECHETLEGAWRRMKGAEKRYVQGLILVCAAFVHLQKGEPKVALGILRRALDQLEFDNAHYRGIDTTSLRRNVERILTTGRLTVFGI